MVATPFYTPMAGCKTLSRDEQRSLKSSTARDPSVAGRVGLSLPQPRSYPRRSGPLQLETEGILRLRPMGENSKQGPGSRIFSPLPVSHQPDLREWGTGVSVWGLVSSYQGTGQREY